MLVIELGRYYCLLSADADHIDRDEHVLEEFLGATFISPVDLVHDKEDVRAIKRVVIERIDDEMFRCFVARDEIWHTDHCLCVRIVRPSVIAKEQLFELVVSDVQVWRRCHVVDADWDLGSCLNSF